MSQNGPESKPGNLHSRRRKKHRASILRLTDDQRREVLTYYAEGSSIRQIALEVGIPRATLQRWILGPLSDEVQKILEERKRRRAASARRNHLRVEEEDRYGLLHHNQPGTEEQDQVEQLPHEEDADQGKPSAIGGDVVEYRPDLLMGGIMTSRGSADPGVPPDQVDIRRTWNGVFCWRCGGLISCDQRDYLFAKGEDGRFRPTCENCRRDGALYYPWPALPGSISHIPSRRR